MKLARGSIRILHDPELLAAVFEAMGNKKKMFMRNLGIYWKRLNMAFRHMAA